MRKRRRSAAVHDAVATSRAARDDCALAVMVEIGVTLDVEPPEAPMATNLSK
jgi:hypothetical protein